MKHEDQITTATPDESLGRQIDRARYDAIHRALLCGLLGNVGTKSQFHEYTGARGRKFHVFPGSGLCNRKPPWVMAAELVETTKLYARTVARIDPAWIERVAAHLVERQYSDPHWHRRSAHVIAFEKVTLYGLVVVPRRRVHFGPIDPKASREIFIREAFVHGEFDTQAPWFRHNRQLLRDVEMIEAKLRRRDILVDAQSRYDFYDARIPARVYDGPLFEKWRSQAEQKNRRVLFMRPEDIMLPVPMPKTGQFPDAVFVDASGHSTQNVAPDAPPSIRLPVRYLFEPGHPADGATVTIPLGLLNQLPAESFQWLVPGWLEEKVVALIKTLPKEQRIHFVPVPESARYAVTHMQFGDGSLPAALSWQLGRLTGIQIPSSAFQHEALPEWLRFNFRIIDEAGKPIESGRDLDEIRRKLSVELKQTFEALSDPQWHRDDITRWDFGDLPEQVEVRRPGITIKGFPALVDRGEGVSLRLLESAAAASKSMRAGVRRLFMIQVAAEIKHIARHLPHFDRIALNYSTLGAGDALKRDLIDVIVDRALFADESADSANLRSRDQFASRAEAGWRRLTGAAAEVCERVDAILERYQSLSRRLTAPHPPMFDASIADMSEQLRYLLAPGFVASTPFPWLREIPRFLRGIEMRLGKLTNAGASRDFASLAEIRPLWEEYLRRAEGQRLRGVEDGALMLARWMLEELRVSLFAQELKTSMLVSAKRVQAQLNAAT